MAQESQARAETFVRRAIAENRDPKAAERRPLEAQLAQARTASDHRREAELTGTLSALRERHYEQLRPRLVNPEMRSANPFELRFRLSTEAASIASAGSINPFDVVVPHRVPGAAKSLSENATEPFRPFSVLPRGSGLPTTVLFWMLVGMIGFLAFSVAANRAVVNRAWRGFLSDNALALIQQHHAKVREVLGQFPAGKEISTAGDSFFLVFGNPSDAVRFALLLQA